MSLSLSIISSFYYIPLSLSISISHSLSFYISLPLFLSLASLSRCLVFHVCLNSLYLIGLYLCLTFSGCLPPPSVSLFLSIPRCLFITSLSLCVLHVSVSLCISQWPPSLCLYAVSVFLSISRSTLFSQHIPPPPNIFTQWSMYVNDHPSTSSQIPEDSSYPINNFTRWSFNVL